MRSGTDVFPNSNMRAQIPYIAGCLVSGHAASSALVRLCDDMVAHEVKKRVKIWTAIEPADGRKHEHDILSSTRL